jgi:hypothetical protein
MAQKKLGAAGKGAPKGKRQQHDPIKNPPVDGAATGGTQELHSGAPQTAQRIGGALRRGDALRLRRAAVLRHERLNRLIDEDLRRHGSLGIRALLDGLERDYGIPDLERRLEQLVDQDPCAIALLDFVGGAR